MYLNRYYWFKAIIENDGPRVRELMTLGYDINSRPTTEDVGPLMHDVWTNRCAASTIFFDVFHPQEAMRPRGIHLAVFFSSVDALKLLVGGMVWFIYVLLFSMLSFSCLFKYTGRYGW